MNPVFSALVTVIFSSRRSNPVRTQLRRMTIITGSMLLALALAAPAFSEPVSQGVACVPNCGDGLRAIELAQKGGYLVLALDRDPANVAKAKQAAAAAGLLGRNLYVEQGMVDNIPFADNYVDMLMLGDVADKDLPDAQRKEILRVLTPIRGRAVLKDKTIAKPELPGSDWWTHKLHGPDNNPVSKDTVFQFPPILQYRAMPMYTTGHGASLTANGIHYEINDWLFTKPVRVNLCGRIFARNAYNGRLLWEADAPKDIIPTTPITLIMDGNLCIASGDAAEVIRYDGATGALLPPIAVGGAQQRVRWMAHQDGILYVLLGGPAELKKAFSFYVPAVMSQWEGHSLFGTELMAWDVAAGKTLWKHTEPKPIDYRNVALSGHRLFFYAEKSRLACLDAADGKQVWENTEGEWIEKLNRPAKPHNVYVSHVSSLIAADGLLRLSVAECKDMFLFDAGDGRLLSSVRGSIQKTLILDGKLCGAQAAYDSKTGAKLDTSPASPAGAAWCGLVTYAKGTGILGHSTLNYKSACAAGVWVAGGTLIYSPTICDCGATPGAGGFVSGAGILNRIRQQPDHPIIQGPAFEALQKPQPASGNPKDWVAYRGDHRHRGSSPAAVGSRAKTVWTAAPARPFAFTTLYNQNTSVFDERPAPPIFADGAVYTAGSDGVIRALSLEKGEPIWTFCADGPVFTSPVWWEGALFVPCGDGWVYALEAKTGRLAWRRRLAPLERRIVLFDQLVSNWPVLSLVVEKGIVYASAGHAVTDGVKTFALEARSGAIVWSHFDEPAEKSYQGSHNPPDRPVQGCGGQMTLVGSRLWGAGYFSTPLTLDKKSGEDHLLELKQSLLGKSSYYAGKKLLQTRGQDLVVLDERAVLVGGGDLFDEPHLREGKRGRTAYQLFLPNEQGDWGLDPAPPDVFISRIAPACDDQLLVFAAQPSYEIKAGKKREVRFTPMTTTGLNAWPTKDFLKTARSLQQTSVIDKGEKPAYQAKRLTLLNPMGGDVFKFLEFEGARWRKPELDVNALALAQNAVLVAHASGYEDLYGWNFDEQTRRQPMVKYAGWKLTAFDRHSGAEMWSLDLPCEPLFNGLCVAADGRVIVALRDGGLVCAGE